MGRRKVAMKAFREVPLAVDTFNSTFGGFEMKRHRVNSTLKESYERFQDRNTQVTIQMGAINGMIFDNGSFKRDYGIRYWWHPCRLRPPPKYWESTNVLSPSAQTFIFVA